MPLRTPAYASVFAAVCGLALSPATASAEELYLLPGITVTTVLGAPQPTWGFGVECSLVQQYPDTATAFVGGVARAQLFTDGTFRAAVSAEAGVLALGAELGVAIRTGNAARDVAISLHGALFGSLAYTYAAWDLNVALGAPRGVRPFEHLLHLGLKLPFQRAPRYVSGPNGIDPVIDGHQWELVDPFARLAH